MITTATSSARELTGISVAGRSRERCTTGSCSHYCPNGLDPMEKPHTLEEYAVDHFRPPPKRTASKSLTISRLVSSLFIVKKTFAHVDFFSACAPVIWTVFALFLSAFIYAKFNFQTI